MRTYLNGRPPDSVRLNRQLGNPSSFPSLSHAIKQHAWSICNQLEDSTTDTNTAGPSLAGSICSRPHCTVRVVKPQIIPVHARLLGATATITEFMRVVTGGRRGVQCLETEGPTGLCRSRARH